jgi:hypothetical protein
VASLIEESKFFIEWTTHEAQIETAARLVELHVAAFSSIFLASSFFCSQTESTPPTRH